jgi:tetrahydromethanopterin S-methyltransferase subunit H
MTGVTKCGVAVKKNISVQMACQFAAAGGKVYETHKLWDWPKKKKKKKRQTTHRLFNNFLFFPSRTRQ